MTGEQKINFDAPKAKKIVSAERFALLKELISLREKDDSVVPDSEEQDKLHEKMDKIEKQLGKYEDFVEDIDLFQAGELAPDESINKINGAVSTEAGQYIEAGPIEENKPPVKEIDKKEVLKSDIERGSLLPDKILGRAEYEKMGDRVLFENKDPREVYPWLFEERNNGYGQGMIVAPRGSGKTFLVRRIMEEIPTELHILDKNTLEYVKRGSDNPKLIVLDDLHYLLEAKRLEELTDKEPRITEEKILDILESSIKDAQERKVKLVFVSNGVPADLYNRFSKKENQSKFLQLLRDCGNQYNTSSGGSNVLRLREKVDRAFIDNVRSQISAFDIPLSEPYSAGESHLVTPDGQEVAGRLVGAFYAKKKDIFMEEDRKPGTNMITRVRELMALSQALGSVNRESLGIDFGIPLGETFEGIAENPESIGVRNVADPFFVSIFNKYDDFMKIRPIVEKEYIDKFNSRLGKTASDNNAENKRPLSHLKEEKDNKKLFRFFLKSRGIVEGPLLSVANTVVSRRNVGVNHVEVGDTLKKSYNRAVSTATYKRGRPNTGEGWVYGPDELFMIKKKLHDLYFNLTRDAGGDSLAAKLLDINEDASPEEVEKLFLEHNLGQE